MVRFLEINDRLVGRVNFIFGSFCPLALPFGVSFGLGARSSLLEVDEMTFDACSAVTFFFEIRRERRCQQFLSSKQHPFL